MSAQDQSADATIRRVRKPAVVILRLKNERTAIVKWLKDLVRVHSDDCEALQHVAVCSILPPIPDAAEGKEPVIRERNRPHSLDLSFLSSAVFAQKPGVHEKVFLLLRADQVFPRTRPSNRSFR